MSGFDSAKRVMSGTFGELWWDGELVALLLVLKEVL